MQSSTPLHPGEILREEFLTPHRLRPYSAAQLLGVPRTRIERIVAGTQPVTPDTALRLARLFRTTAQFWLDLQARHDLAATEARMSAELDQIVPLPKRRSGGASRFLGSR